MIKLKGKVTKVEEANLEVDKDELEKAFRSNFCTQEIIKLAWGSWMKDKGLSSDSILLMNPDGTHYWKSYEDNGSHYSGYFEVKGKYEAGDEIVYTAFQSIFRDSVIFPKTKVIG